MKNRPKGIETEFGMCVPFVNADVPDLDTHIPNHILGPLRFLAAESQEKMDPRLRYFAPVRMGASASEYWIGATGGKLYGDYGSEVLEYAAPECLTCLGVACADKAGERVVKIFNDLVFAYSSAYDNTTRPALITKDNSDLARGNEPYFSNFYASHEQYYIRREFFQPAHIGGSPQGEGWARVCALASLCAARVLVAGAGGIFFTPEGGWQYTLSERALTSSGKEIWGSPNDRSYGRIRKMMIEKSDSGDTPEEFTRLQIAAADSNMMRHIVHIRFVLVDLLLRVFEETGKDAAIFPVFESPAEALHEFASDPTLRVRMRLEKGGDRTVVEALREWLEILMAFAEIRGNEVLREDRAILKRAHQIVTNSAGDPDAFSSFTDWGLKYDLLRRFCGRKNVGIGDSRARRLAISYADISPAGIFNRRECARGVKPKLFSTEEFVALTSHEVVPRARLRKRLLRALFRAGRTTGSGFSWGLFSAQLGSGDVKIEDPLQGSHSMVENEIAALEERYGA